MIPTVVIGAPVVIMLALAYAALRFALWRGRESHRRPLNHITARPGYELSGYENGVRVMELWPAIMAQAAGQDTTPQDTRQPAGPVTRHDGYCGPWDK